MSFSSLGLSPDILKAIEDQGYKTPSPIQAKTIPAIMDGKDVIASAQTGTGKTAGFTLPILDILEKGERAQKNQARVLVLTPTRELAIQVAESVKAYGKHLPLRTMAVFGGVKINPQMMKLRKGVDVLVATPGRLLDLYQQKAVKFKHLEVLVLDEADRMLDMGFIHDINKILAVLPKNRQSVLFSATFSDEIRQLAKNLLNDPVEISVTPNNTTVKKIKQWICPVDKKQKPALLIKLIRDNNWNQVLVFAKTKHGADRLTRQLQTKGIVAAAIHGNKSQNARTKALREFKEGEIQVLIATDIAARGLDIDQLPQVVNVDLPHVPEDYVHRIGRTGRAGAVGQAISLVSSDESKQLSAIEKLIKEELKRKYVEGFQPVHDLPTQGSKKKHSPSKKPQKPSFNDSKGRKDRWKPKKKNGPKNGPKKKSGPKNGPKRGGRS